MALNGVSLGSAIAANMFLLLNFARRIRYRVAQPLTIILWYLSAVLLLVPLCLTDELRIKPHSSHAFSQSYYYALISVVLYLVISTLLLLHSVGAYHFRAYPPSFSTLTVAQRTLMLQTIAYALYIAAGAAVFSSLEDWNFIDGVYWADYTLLTVGLGSDFPLTRTASRALLIPYAVGGIMMIGLIVGSVRGLVLERAVVRMEKARLEKERAQWELDRRSSHSGPQEEYEMMRKIEARAEVARRYSALAMSTTSFCLLWTLGALAFWYAEAPQGWTYFEALYFSYTTLLTIGYGDFYPASNSGKPFFVIWSLIAVPAMTILVSNLGDTLVDTLKFGTILIGRYTILPEREDEPEDFIEDVVEKQHRALMLTKAIRSVAHHLGERPPKRYNWEEWKTFMNLCEDDAMRKMWLADDGPLFSDMDEPKWLMMRLLQELESVLKEELVTEGYSLSGSTSI